MSEQTPGLYPQLVTEREQRLLDKISHTRCTVIKSKVKELELLSSHYEKVRRKWSKALTTIGVIGTGIGSLSAVSGTIAATAGTSGIAIPVIIPAVVAGVGAVQTSPSEITAFVFIKKRVKKYHEKKDLIDKYINRLYHFYHLAIEDSKITPAEMEEYNNILDDYRKESEHILTQEEKEEELDLTTLKAQAMAVAKKSIEAEIRQKLVLEVKAKLRSTVST